MSVNLSVGSLLFCLLYNGESAKIKCSYGEQALCGSDGSTYYNKCDFEIVRSVHSDLTVRHEGACKRGGYVINPFVKIFNALDNFTDIGALRQQRPINGNARSSDFTRMLLSQIINSQTQLNGINFALNTKGDGNTFGINIG